MSVSTDRITPGSARNVHKHATHCSWENSQIGDMYCNGSPAHRDERKRRPIQIHKVQATVIVRCTKPLCKPEKLRTVRLVSRRTDQCISAAMELASNERQVPLPNSSPSLLTEADNSWKFHLHRGHHAHHRGRLICVKCQKLAASIH